MQLTPNAPHYPPYTSPHMRLVSIESIVIRSDRQRQAFDPTEIMELANSIVQNSLLHPPVVRDDGAGKSVLVAGERRLRAIQELWDLGETLRYGGTGIAQGMVPVCDLGLLSPLEAEEAELEENVKRQDLTWQEHALAVKRLAELRRAQAKLAGDDPPSITDIAKETYVPKRDGFDGIVTSGSAAAQTTSQELLIAEHLGDEDVAKAKSLTEAFKVVKAKEATRENERRALALGAKATSELHTLLKGNSLDVIRSWAGDSMQAQTYDVLITDPPYGMGADEFGDSGGSILLGVHKYADDDQAFLNVSEVLQVASATACKPAAHAYIFCDIERFFTLRAAMGSFGWKVFRTPLVWIKNNGRVPLPQHGPRRQYELILYAYRGEKPVISIQPDTIECPTDGNLGLGAQKPVEVYSNLLRRSVRPGDRLLDPFAGTGTIFPAAHALRCRATAIEREENQFGIAAKRLEELK